MDVLETRSRMSSGITPMPAESPPTARQFQKALELDDIRKDITKLGYQYEDVTPAGKGRELTWKIYQENAEGQRFNETVIYPAVYTDSYDPSRPLYKGIFDELGKSSARSFERMAGLVMKSSAVLTEHGSGQMGMQRPDKKTREQEAEVLRTWGDTLRKDADSYALAPARNAPFHAEVLRTVNDSALFMTAVAGSGLLGGPAAAFGTAAYLEGGEATLEIKERKPDIGDGAALLYGLGVGTINASLELLQLKGFMKFAKGWNDDAMRLLKASAHERWYGKMVKGAGRLTSKTTKLGMAEAIPEALQEVSTVVAVAAATGDVTIDEAMDRVWGAGKAGFAMGPLFAGPAIVYDRYVNQGNRNAPLELRDEPIEDTMWQVRMRAMAQRATAPGTPVEAAGYGQPFLDARGEVNVFPAIGKKRVGKTIGEATVGYEPSVGSDTDYATAIMAGKKIAGKRELFRKGSEAGPHAAERGVYYGASEADVKEALLFEPEVSKMPTNKYTVDMKSPLLFKDIYDAADALLPSKTPHVSEAGVDDKAEFALESKIAKQAKALGHDFLIYKDRGGGSPGSGWTEVIDLTKVKAARGKKPKLKLGVGKTQQEAFDAYEKLIPEPVKDAFQSPDGAFRRIWKFFAPKNRLNEYEGTQKIVDETEEGRILYDLYTGPVQNYLVKTTKHFNRKAAAGDRFASWLKNKQSSGVEQMFASLSTQTYMSKKTAPNGWTEADIEMHNKARWVLEELRETANIGRRKAGLDEIKHVDGYLPRFLDQAAGMVEKFAADGAKDKNELTKNRFAKHPLQHGHIWRLAKEYARAPKKFDNPSAHERIVDELKKHYNRNVPELFKAIAAYDLRDALLTNPYAGAVEELSRIGRLKGADKVPDTVMRDLTKFLRYDIARMQTPTDQWLDDTIRAFDFLKLNERVLGRFGREIHSPTATASRFFRSFGHFNALGFRPKAALRNFGQRILLLDLYKSPHISKAQADQAAGVWQKVKVGGREVGLDTLLQSQPWYMATEKYMTEASDTLTSAAGKASTWAFHQMHMSNVNVSARTGYLDWKAKFEDGQNPNSRYHKHVSKTVLKELSKESDAAYKELSDSRKQKVTRDGYKANYIKQNFEQRMTNSLVQEADMIPMIRDAVQNTQWEYFPTSMPALYRGNAAKAALLFKSWGMNYYATHLTEMGHRMLTGKTSRGKVLMPSERFRAVHSLPTIIGAGKAAEMMFGVQVLRFLLMPGVSQDSPLIQTVSGLVRWATADNEYDKNKGKQAFSDGLHIFKPLGGLRRDMQEAEKEGMKGLLTYIKEQEESQKRKDRR